MKRTIKVKNPNRSKQIDGALSSEMLIFFKNIYKSLYFCTYLLLLHNIFNKKVKKITINRMENP